MVRAGDLGGKANVLLDLKTAGFPIPALSVVHHDEVHEITSDDLAKRTSELKGAHFAVRSSANVEDGSVHSFAGIFDTELFVSRDRLLEGILKVHNALNGEVLKTYCASQKIPLKSIKLHIVIQEMIPAHVSGVAFSLDPNKPYRNSPLITAAYGLGEGIVSGQVNADMYVKQSNNWKIKRSGQDNKLVHLEAGLRYVELDLVEANETPLSKAQCDEIAHVLRKLEKHYGQPQDIEFCFVDEEFFLLQSRPITAIRTIQEHVIWDNSNIVESYPGITLPFTFSFILPIYESVYKNFGKLLGVPNRVIESNQEVFAEMLGHIRGRVYYHLINWYKALAMLPAYQLNAAYMEKMMGVSEPLGVPVTLKNTPPKWKNYFYLGRTLMQMVRLNQKLPKLKRTFQKKVQKTIQTYKSKSYEDATAEEVWADYLAFKTILVNEWNPPLANDLLAMIYFGTLQKLCESWLNQDALHTKLVVGQHDVISVKPAQQIRHILKKAKEEDLFSTLHEESSERIWTLCKQGDFGKTGNLILEYIGSFGDRAVGELKLENSTYTTHPEHFIEVLKSYKQSPEVAQQKEQEPIDIPLKGWKKYIFSYVRRKAAEMVSDRENLRFDRTLGFGVVRGFLCQLGQMFEQATVLENERDVFYLKEDEVQKLVNGELKPEDAKNRIDQRKTEYQTYEMEEELPERIHQIDGQLDLERFSSGASDGLSGIPCCAGIVRGKVRVLRSPSDVKSLNGEILVTQSTDPGWITIFQSASAILVERGSTLSHAAIVSREMGIPCIVGIKGLTSTLKTGDVVEMNGSTGIVNKHDQ